MAVTSLLSIIIPCKNEENYLPILFDSLARQRNVPQGTQVYLADAQSTDDSLQIARKFSAFPLHIVSGGHPSIGRNEGVLRSTSKYLLFLDADISLAEDDLIEKMCHLAQKQNLDLVAPHFRCKQDTPFTRFFCGIHNLTTSLRLVGVYATGMCMLMSRDSFERLGGFDPQYHLGEDWNLTHRIPRKRFGVTSSIWITDRRFKRTGRARSCIQYLRIAASKSFCRSYQGYFAGEYPS